MQNIYANSPAFKSKAALGHSCHMLVLVFIYYSNICSVSRLKLIYSCYCTKNSCSRLHHDANTAFANR